LQQIDSFLALGKFIRVTSRIAEPIAEHFAAEVTPSKKHFQKLLKSNLDFGANGNSNSSRHYWHSFPAKFPPDLPRFFIKNLTEENDVILDPMAGSCTTLIEAASLGRKCIGFDIDPLSLTIGRAKLENFKPAAARAEGLNVLELARFDFQMNKNKLESELEKRFDKETLAFLDYWWFKKIQLELFALLRQIEQVDDELVRNLLQMVFSAIIITKSGGVTRAMDLAHTRPHRVTTKKPNSAFDEFGKKLEKILRNGYNDLPVQSLLQKGDAKKLDLEDGSADLIITSPPYANNAIDYMRAHKFSLVWFGYGISQLQQLRKEYIGAQTRQEKGLDELPPQTCKIVTALTKVNKNKGLSLLRYYSEMRQVISEMYRVLKPERACVIVVATSVLNGIDVETHKCLGEIGEMTGFELAHIRERNIHRDRRMLPTSRNKSNSLIEARMHNEFVIGLWKN